MFQIPDGTSSAAVPGQQEDEAGRRLRADVGRLQAVHLLHVRHTGARGPHAEAPVQFAGLVQWQYGVGDLFDAGLHLGRPAPKLLTLFKQRVKMKSDIFQRRKRSSLEDFKFF